MYAAVPRMMPTCVGPSVMVYELLESSTSVGTGQLSFRESEVQDLYDSVEVNLILPGFGSRCTMPFL
jgi:hypothetical protein